MTVYDGIKITSSDVGKIIDLISELDCISEELRIRQQEIFQYKDKETLLELQLRQAQIIGEILKLIREYLRYVRIEEEPEDEINPKKEIKSNDRQEQ